MTGVQTCALPIFLPVTSIDKLPVGGGQVGELTKKLRQRYFDIVRGNTPDHPEWRTVV